ncbi:MAG: hypothetical protein AB7O24_24035 [Kofleriaceae bacterium]
MSSDLAASLRFRRFAKTFAIAAALAAVGCKKGCPHGGVDPIDASPAPIDSSPPDSPPDSSPDAAPAVACSDGIDNDLDGHVDHPADPGCDAATDDSEADICQGDCPACSDGIDQDSDGLIDYPEDYGCASRNDDEAFCDVYPYEDRGPIITTPLTSDVLTSVDELEACDNKYVGASKTFPLQLPVPVATLEIKAALDPGGEPLFMELLTARCLGSFGCTLSSPTLVINDVAAGNYALLIDSDVGPFFDYPFTVEVRGTVTSGTACTSPLFDSGLLACPGNQPCTAGVCP